MSSNTAFSPRRFTRMRRLFERVSKLLRSQQKKIAAVPEACVNQRSDREV
jgi:hypothetical protein